MNTDDIVKCTLANGETAYLPRTTALRLAAEGRVTLPKDLPARRDFVRVGNVEIARRQVRLKFPRRQPEFSCSINHLRWMSGLVF